MTPHVFRAIWPVVDATIPFGQLLLEAHADLPKVAARHRAELTGPATWALRPGGQVPGSGGHPVVLVATAPATPIARPVDDDQDDTELEAA